MIVHRSSSLFRIKGEPASLRLLILITSTIIVPSIAGCADDICLSHPPAFEVKVEWQGEGSVSQVSLLTAEITAAGLTKEISLDSQPLKTRGWLRFAVEVGNAGDPDFIGAVNLEARDEDGEAIARGELSFDGSGDACNFFEMPLNEISCTPNCDGKACGTDDGCGSTCQAGTPNCDGKACGADDGCGSTCQAGVCADGQHCVDGVCTCDSITCPDGCCLSGACFPGTSDDHCGGGGDECLDCLTDEKACNQDQTCITCTPLCEGKSCGAGNGCGGTCSGGSCPAGQVCDGGHCVCNATSCPNGCCSADSRCLGGTDNSSCGKDGNLCSSCSAPAQICSDQACQACSPACAGACDITDGCGGTCSCNGDDLCESNACVPVECRLCINDQAYGENTTQSTFTDCNTMCTFFGAPSGLCAYPGSTDGRECCDCQNKTSGFSPQGVLQSVTSGLITGWTCDPDDPWESILVAIFVGGITTGYPSFSTRANRPSEESISNLCGGGYYHHFEYQIPNWSAMVGFQLYVYGLNVQAGNNGELVNSGVVLQ